MSEEDIQEAIAGFALAARHAREAGFDGVELHGANGYLLHEFMSVEFNQRSDQWGGTFLERLRMPLAVIAAVRAAVGENSWWGCDCRRAWSATAGSNGRAARNRPGSASVYWLMQGSTICTSPSPMPAHRPSERPEPCRHRQGQRSDPVIGNGAIVTGEQAEALLGRGEMDLVAVGKAALANNDWPQRIQQGIELSDFDGSMFVPMATITNELAWRNANDRPALRSS